MRIFVIASFLLAQLSLAACTKKADNIAAAYISPIAYDGHSCKQIREEMQRVSARAAEVAGIQDNASTNDKIAMGVGLVVFWPALFLLSGGNEANAAELARLKGTLQALEQTGIKKNCGIKIQQAEAPPPPRNVSADVFPQN